VPSPVGPTGIPCGDETGDDAAAPEWEVGAAIGTTRASIRFDGESDYELEQHAFAASIGRRLGERTVVRLSAGAIFGGELRGEGRGYELGPGWLFSVSGAQRLFGLPERAEFVTLSLAFGASSTATEQWGGGAQERLSASDLRVGLIAGVTLWRTLSPYALVRGFGGPIAFRQAGRDRIGSDRHHFALGAGSAVALPAGAQLAVEAALLGERSLTAGGLWTF
jgi:hypothetical protein